ncbi:hypothetical protein DFP73DRAFT_124943 [Morchella snyderi]|nr:hypothetical protein DFP73DRAFT_124943 [Morchella snyderi]
MVQITLLYLVLLTSSALRCYGEKNMRDEWESRLKAVVRFCPVLVGVCDIDSFLFPKQIPPLLQPPYEVYMYNYISLKNSLLRVSFLGQSVFRNKLFVCISFSWKFVFLLTLIPDWYIGFFFYGTPLFSVFIFPFSVSSLRFLLDEVGNLRSA